MLKKILVIDDEIRFCKSLCEILEAENLPAVYSTSSSRALQIIAEQDIDLVFLDIKMPESSGIDLLRGIRARDPTIPVIMITGYPSVDNIVQSMKLGASNVFAKPPNIDELIRVTRILLASRSRRTRDAPDTAIVTKSLAMRKVLDAIERIAPIEAPILITGESGTGKELCANAIFGLSRRKDRPFIKVNSAAIPENLMESELFGHERGAFTDAVATRKGRFELASGGTIFLDEIADMTLTNQAKILRVLQEKEFERVGSSEVIRTDIRVLAATSKNLPELMQQGRFREDLYYRLSVITIELPPLRERRDDVLLLAAHFVDRFNEVYSRRIRGLDDEVKELFLRHDWPGNVRELRNCVERAVIFCEGDRITSADLPAQYRAAVDARRGGTYEQAYASFSRDVILDALARSEGRKAKAAELLHIDRRTLYNRMKRLGL
ncbi:MAG: sigma-54 dependent transcriptional regulator [Spirochaetes bacterium]|nr:sigma-54 dependent transcriptional regulator [Spirochaetota bacterium]